MGMVNQICYEQKMRKSLVNGQIRLKNEMNNNIMKDYMTNRINISIKKTYNKNHKRNNSITFRKTNYFDIQLNEKFQYNTNNKIEEIIKTEYTIKRTNIYNQKDNILNNKKYKKGQLIGQGRFGKVYSGLSELNGEIVAIKTYYNLSIDKKKLIMKNKDTLYKLNHPNIIKVLSLFDDNENNLNIVYDSLNINNVKQLINKFGKLNEKIIQIYSKQLLEGLKYLHEKKIYHKNLKPSNILVDIDGTIKITDCFIDSLCLGDEEEIYNNLLNSNNIEYYIPTFFIKYMKNNIKRNKFEEWQSYDLWFIGCIIIEVASGKKPWSQYNFKNNSELFNFLEKQNITPDISKNLSKECQELIQTLLNPFLTNKKNIYEIIFNLNFYKSDLKYYNTIKSKNSSSILANNKSRQDTKNSNKNITVYTNSIRDSQLGNVLEKNKVINILNSHNTATFSVSQTIKDIPSNDCILKKSNLTSSHKSNNCNDYVYKDELNLSEIKSINTDMSEMQIDDIFNSIKKENIKNLKIKIKKK